MVLRSRAGFVAGVGDLTIEFADFWIDKAIAIAIAIATATVIYRSISISRSISCSIL